MRNLSNAALTSGLEWNTKVTKRDLPETIDKIAATFEYYWNDREFEYYDEGQKERLAYALKAEKYFDTNNADVYTMDINPYSYQELICKGWFLPPNTYDCGSFVVNGTAVVGKEKKSPYNRWKSTQKGANFYEISI